MIIALMGFGVSNAMAAAIALAKTGQQACFHSDGTTTGTKSCDNTTTGQDGDLKVGEAWPNPRFTDNSDGTILDNLTGLIWLKDASCSNFATNGEGTFLEALTEANDLANGACGLSDNSSAGDWRLPNIKELESLTHYEFDDLGLPNTVGTAQGSNGSPFADAEFGYWSSTTALPAANLGMVMRFDFSSVGKNTKNVTHFIWPVKGSSSTNFPAPVSKTGQTLCYDPTGALSAPRTCAGTGQDGEYKEGVALPSPRFTDNGDGTVTDNLSGLVWLQEANCFSIITWQQALNAANALNDSNTASLADDCGLQDKSTAGSWRLPNIRELFSLINFDYTGRPNGAFSHPGISNASGSAGFVNDSFTNPTADYPFTYIQPELWSSTSDLGISGRSAFTLLSSTGEYSNQLKSNSHGVWLVRSDSAVPDDDFLLLVLPAIISGSKNIK